MTVPDVAGDGASGQPWTVILWTTGDVMVFAPNEDYQQDRMGPYAEMLPALLARPEHEVRWWTGRWDPGAWRRFDTDHSYLVPVPREFIEAFMAADIDRVIALLEASAGDYFVDES